MTTVREKFSGSAFMGSGPRLRGGMVRRGACPGHDPGRRPGM